MARGQLAYYELLERRGLLADDSLGRRARAALGELDATTARSEPIGYILAMEGADPIVEPSQAVEWWNLGLRSVNLAHYGESRYAVGTGDDGPLTPEGIQLLKEFEQLGMILDATHLCDTSFFQALDVFSGPVLASHNNCRALVAGGRQFSDEQIRLLIERDAVIGAALDAWMLAPGWIRGQTSREVVATRGRGRSSRPRLPACRRRPPRRDRQRPGRRLRHRANTRRHGSDLRPAGAGGNPGPSRLYRDRDRRNLSRQLVALFQQAPAGMTE